MIVVETIKSNKRLLLLVFFILLGPLMTHAQDVQIATPVRDSVVIEDAAGNVEVLLKPHVLHPSVSGNKVPSIKSKSYLTNDSDIERANKEESLKMMRANTPKSQVRSQSEYAVGSIPVSTDVTALGARTYSVPVTTASGWKLNPNISLTYNSMSGNGVAGYGWSLAGLSSIKIRNKNYYYDNAYGTCNYDDSDAKYALDGLPVVQSTFGLPGFTFATSKGNIQIKKHLASNGVISYFTALFPDGSVGTYGYENNVSFRNEYPLTALIDKNGNTLTFSYVLLQEIYYVTRIDYGKNASISFSYSSRADSAPYRFSWAGRFVDPTCRLLKSITSKDGQSTICQYNLIHEEKDGVCLLKELNCTSGTSALPPLTFSYGVDFEEDGSSGQFNLSDESMFVKYFTKSSDLNLIYKRGRFLPGNPNDGVIVLPEYETYAKIGYKKKWHELHRFYKYGSKYAADQEILCNLTGYYSSVQKTILTEEGFQLIEAVDVNGDGLDELVKVNNSSSTAGVTDFKITIYSFDRNGNYTSSSFNISINDGTSNKYYTNPAKCYYRFGDFRGNGKTMLLIMSRDDSLFALVDLNSRTKASERSLFKMSEEEQSFVFPADLENDGKTDLCHVTSSGLDVYSVADLTGTLFSLRTTYQGANRQSLCSDPNNLYNGVPQIVPSIINALDLNGDGYTDIFSYPDTYTIDDDILMESSIVHIAHFNGKRFSTETKSLFTRKTEDKIRFLDADHDGLPDMLHVRNSKLYFVPNKKGNFYAQASYSNVTLDATAEIIPGDVSIFGNSGDILIYSGPYVKLYEFSINHDNRRKLTRMTDGFGNESTSTYGRISGYSGVYLIDSDRTYNINSGFSRSRIPLTVLRNSQIKSDNQIVDNQYFTYWDAVVNNRGLGFCGFGKVRSIDYINGVYLTKTNDPERFGVTTQEIASYGYNSSPYSTVDYTYDNNYTIYGKLNPRLIRSVATNTLTGVETTISYTYGSYDLPTSVQTLRRIGTGTPQTETIARTYQNSLNPSMYVLGTVTKETVTKESDGQTGTTWKERRDLTYDNLFRPLTQKSYVGTSGTNLLSETHWQYDSHGNVLSRMSSPYGASEYTGETFCYDSDGRYLTASTDALGHTTTYSGYNRFGKPTLVTDHWNRSSTLTYDAWGNLTGTAYADGTGEETTTEWGGAGLYTVTVTSTGKPETITHYDALGREIRSGVQRFTGQWQYTDREYDTRGQLSRQSLPFRGESASFWSTYQYDAYGRPTGVVEASGKTTSWSYNGTSVTTTKDGISSTSTTDAGGNVVSVTDAGGTITYSLRDDGQPSSVTAPGNVVTTFTYDSYGRRTGIADPSAGTRTESYSWNSDGSHSVTHTNPNGSVTMHYDRYGRTTSVERPGEYNTTYTYDSRGRAIGEQSTNGTGRIYTYDDYDRVATMREIVPDGKWLEQTISYGSDGNVSGVGYSTQDGVITTESYTYSYGHNTRISLPDGTLAWRLDSENDLGMPTSATTGSVTREYGYTSFGLPTYRRMDNGALQDFTYQFDVTTGNLLVRQDGVNGQAETFGYDNLNRLTAIGGRQISYSDNGNVISMDGVGTMSYDNGSRPYQITSLHPADEALVPARSQSVSYTCYDRPSVLSEGGRSVAFTYNGEGDRVKMYVADGTSEVLTRHYIGSRYEHDHTPSGIRERLYLGGDAYSAPMVYERENGGGWTLYNIGRDYLGNVTHIATSGGTLVSEYSYDPWGRLRDPDTHAVYSPGQEPELFLGRGFTGHEHLPWFGLVNMNARLYDPLLGRFLSPDPYVQAPDFTQNYNRYIYCLNNPLKFTDRSGEYAAVDDLIAVAAGALLNWMANGFKFNKEGLYYFSIGAALGWSALYITPMAAYGLAEGANSAVRQGYGDDGKWNSDRIDLNTVIFDGIIGAATYKIGGIISNKVSPWINNTINKYCSPKIANFLTKSASGKALNSAASNAASGLVIGTGITYLNTQDFGQSIEAGGNAAWRAAALGGFFGFIEGYSFAKDHGYNPWNGQAIKSENTVVLEDWVTADDLGIRETVDRINRGDSYPHANDGTVHRNDKLILPEKPEGYYHEYVVPTRGVPHAGLQRIVTGAGGEWYYTPDHYETFFRFKP